MALSRQTNSYDLIKASTIILVVIGHIVNKITVDRFPQIDTSLAYWITFLIYSFHMPLFMAASGSVFNIAINRGGDYDNFQSFITNKFKRLIIPYLFIGMIFLVPVLIFTNDSGEYSDFLLGGDSSRHLWFLLALFEIFIICYILYRLKINIIVAFVVSIVFSILLPLFQKYISLFQMPMTFTMLPYFIIGILLDRHKHLLESYATKKNVIIICVCLVTYLLLLSATLTNVSESINHLIMIMRPFPLITALYIMASMGVFIIKNSILMTRALNFMLDYSFGIYLFHVIVIYVIVFFREYFHNIYCFFICSFVLSFFIPIVLVSTIRKINISFFIGEKNKK